jgi:hypothetical protein
LGALRWADARRCFRPGCRKPFAGSRNGDDGDLRLGRRRRAPGDRLRSRPPRLAQPLDRFDRRFGRSRVAFGLLLALVGLAVLTGFDHRIESALVAALPDWLAGVATTL